MKFRLPRLFSAFSLLFLISGFAWAVTAATPEPQVSVGKVEQVQGQGWGVSQWGKKYDKLGGDLLVLNEVVATGIRSSMSMRFIDETAMTLGPSAEITIDAMVYNPENGENDTAVFNLGKGTFYFVSGLVAKEKVVINTPTATIGIRGTELVINVEDDGTTSVGVAKGRAIMTSKREGRSVDIDTGKTARTTPKGEVSKPFSGIDLTGEDEIDSHLKGYSEWRGDENRKEERDLTEFSNEMDSSDAEFGRGDDGEVISDKQYGENDSEPGEDITRNRTEIDNDEVDRRESDDGEGDGEGDDGGDDGGDSDGGDDGGDSGGGDDGGDSDGGDDGGDGGSSRDGRDGGDRD